MYTHTRARALINGRATNLNTKKKKKKKKNLLHSRAPYFIRDFRYSFTTTHSKSFLFFSPFVLDAKGHERSLSSKRGAASSPYFSTLLFLVPYSHERLHTKSSCFFLIVPSQKKERFPELRVWFLLVRVFASVALRERERERGVRPFFFSFVALLGRPFSIASGAERARVEREKERERERFPRDLSTLIF